MSPCCNPVAAVPAPGQTGLVQLSWTVVPAPGPIAALTVGATPAGLALVAFGDNPDAAAHAAHRLGVPAVRSQPEPGAAASDRASVPASAPGPGRRAADRAVAGDVQCGPHAQRLAGPGPLAAAVAQLREYLAGGRRSFDLALDWSLTRGAQRRVLTTLFATVGYGETVTYGELAARSDLGSAYTAARGVGSIMGGNPLPVVVPCHRVMAADGLGGFGGGRATKEWLLAHEGVLTTALDLDPPGS